MTRLLFIVAMLAVLAVSVPEIAPAVLARFSAGPAEPSPPPVADPPEAAAPAEPQLSPRRVALAADPRGHFLANAEVNGRTVDVMVDTGATIVALNEATAAPSRHFAAAERLHRAGLHRQRHRQGRPGDPCRGPAERHRPARRSGDRRPRHAARDQSSRHELPRQALPASRSPPAGSSSSSRALLPAPGRARVVPTQGPPGCFHAPSPTSFPTPRLRDHAAGEADRLSRVRRPLVVRRRRVAPSRPNST